MKMALPPESHFLLLNKAENTEAMHAFFSAGSLQESKQTIKESDSSAPSPLPLLFSLCAKGIIVRSNDKYTEHRAQTRE